MAVAGSRGRRLAFPGSGYRTRLTSSSSFFCWQVETLLPYGCF